MDIFDRIANANEWLEAYQAKELERLVGLYADHATHVCGCSGQKLFVGKLALRAYWTGCFDSQPVHQSQDIKPDGEAVALSYVTASGPVKASLIFNSLGEIAHAVCGPSK